jgi:hypothetical protein
LSLRPIFHWSEERVRGHVGLCVLAATIEAVMAKDLLRAKVMDPDLPFQSMTPRRALALLKEVRIQHLAAGTQQIKAREPAQCPPGQGAAGALGRHLNRVQGRNRLSRTFRLRGGRKSIRRARIYLGRRESRAKASHISDKQK